MLPFEDLTRAFVTLFVIIDPIGTLPIFLSLTAGMATDVRRRIVVWTMIFTLIVLAAVVFIGDMVLRSMGVTAEAFRIAGGLFLFWIAFEMVHGKRQERREKTAANTPSNPELRALAISPLTIPLLAGPGSITAIIILTQELNAYHERFALAGVVLALIVLCAMIFLLAVQAAKFISDTMQLVLTRIMGLLLGALSVQIIIDSVQTLFA